jgi:hypothetical protein
MLWRILILVAAVLVGIWLLKKAFSGRQPPKDPDRSDSEGRLIQCAHCGTRLPASDAHWKEGQAYCSVTHRHLGPK